MQGPGNEAFDEVQIAAITSGFANNTSLRDFYLVNWRAADLAPVLTVLQKHPALQNIELKFIPRFSLDISSPSGLAVLLRSQDVKVKELVLDIVGNTTVGFHIFMQKLGRNTTVTELAIRNSVLSRENLQQLTVVLPQNTVLQSLDLMSSALGSAGLAEIAPALHCNTSIKTLDLASNDLDDIEST